MKDTTLLFTLTDADGIKGRDPVRLVLVAVADQPPQMAVQLDGIGTAVTPQARIPAVGRITDDYGLGRVWFEHAVDQREAGPPQHWQSSSTAPRIIPPISISPKRCWSCAELGLKPGQKLSVSVKAADLCDLGHGSERLQQRTLAA